MWYQPAGYDETFNSQGLPRPVCHDFLERIETLGLEQLAVHQNAAELQLRNAGITFNVYGHEEGVEKVWPFDVMPRVIDANEWCDIDKGLRQRVTALNLFIDDIYNDQNILNDGIVPKDLILSADTYRPEMQGFSPTHKAWCHISGVDLVRNDDGKVYVLEDNLRCPSGVSYVLENREVMKRSFAKVFEGVTIAPIEEYPERLLQTLLSCAPKHVENPRAVVLTPGTYNSAYFEHTFLAQQMGVELVQGCDLVVMDDIVYMRTTKGLQRIDVIYRRIDDDFLDPECFREDSCIGVAGLMRAYRAGNVTLANAPGTGVADDKAVYNYVPQIIKYYLDEEPILNNVPTHLCSDPDICKYVLENLDKLVVKPTNESGGYGIVIGPHASKKELAEVAELIKGNPRNYIAQPMLNLSTVPTLIDQKLAPRHVDLRPFVLAGEEIYVMPGGLTRVALIEGSTIVNSSQGGGSKDTWVLKNGSQQ